MFLKLIQAINVVQQKEEGEVRLQYISDWAKEFCMWELNKLENSAPQVNIKSAQLTWS